MARENPAERPAGRRNAAVELHAVLTDPRRTAAQIERATRRLIEDFGPALLREARRFTGLGDHDAEDLLIDTVMAFIDHFQKPGVPRCDAPAAYLLRIYRNRAIDRMRALAKEREHEAFSLDELAEPEHSNLPCWQASDGGLHDPARVLAGRQALARGLDAISAEKSEDRRTVFGLMLNGCERREIAMRTSRSPSAAGDMMHRVRRVFEEQT